MIKQHFLGLPAAQIDDFCSLIDSLGIAKNGIFYPLLKFNSHSELNDEIEKYYNANALTIYEIALSFFNRPNEQRPFEEILKVTKISSFIEAFITEALLPNGGKFCDQSKRENRKKDTETPNTAFEIKVSIGSIRNKFKITTHLRHILTQCEGPKDRGPSGGPDFFLLVRIDEKTSTIYLTSLIHYSEMKKILYKQFGNSIKEFEETGNSIFLNCYVPIEIDTADLLRNDSFALVLTNNFDFEIHRDNIDFDTIEFILSSNANKNC